MAGIKTIVAAFVVLVAGCFLITFMAVAEGVEQIDEEYAPGFYYTVKKGDTLWDLSKKFYDSEWRWPAMWEQNKKLTNPHMIYPGQRIRLYQVADALKQVETAEAFPTPMPISPEEEAASEEETTAQAPAAIPDAVYYLYPGISSVGFIKRLPGTGQFDKSAEDPLAMGFILKAAGEEKEMISEYDTVYISPMPSRAASAPFIVGNRYSIYSPPVRVNDPKTGNYTGHQYKIIGLAEVTAVASEYTTAKIIKSLDTIGAGCFIMPFEKRDKEIAIKPSPAGLTGTLLMAEDNTEMSGEYSIVFMNKGKRDGVQAGQRYDIYREDKSKIDGKEVVLPHFVFGKVLVLLAEDTTATAVITKSLRPISRGDLFKSAL